MSEQVDDIHGNTNFRESTLIETISEDSHVGVAVVHMLGWQLYCHPFPGAAVQLPHQLMETISED
jgi:hypothetical protein